MNEEFDWEQDIINWTSKRKNIDTRVTKQIIEFFRLAFTNTRYPEQSWFGVHKSIVSLVRGGIFLAAIHRCQEIWLLVDQHPPQIQGVDYRPVKSTENSETPLVWLHTADIANIILIIDSGQLWKSYAKASNKIMNSPVISANRDKVQEIRRKRLVSSFWR